MKTAIRNLAIVLAALTVGAGSVQANGRHGGHRGGAHVHGHAHHWAGHGHWRPGLFWGVVGFGLGVGAARYYYYGDPWYPGYVVVEPPPVAFYVEPRPSAREPLAKGPPDPVIYPSQGQTAAQTEADRQDCNRWAMTQPGAMADASVFHRATIACMEGRGYTVR